MRKSRTRNYATQSTQYDISCKTYLSPSVIDLSSMLFSLPNALQDAPAPKCDTREKSNYGSSNCQSPPTTRGGNPEYFNHYLAMHHEFLELPKKL